MADDATTGAAIAGNSFAGRVIGGFKTADDSSSDLDRATGVGADGFVFTAAGAAALLGRT